MKLLNILALALLSSGFLADDRQPSTGETIGAVLLLGGFMAAVVAFGIGIAWLPVN